MSGKRMNNARSSGYTLVEMMASITLLILALGMAMTGYLFALKNVNEGDVQNDLDIDVMLAMEQLKKDLRLSSLDN
ncbi:PilW family protein, partial [Pontiella sp.]